MLLGSGKDYIGVLIYPDWGNLRVWAADHGVGPDDLAGAAAVRDLYASEIERINSLIDVKYQRIRRAVLADRAPSLDNGELTPSGKLVRKTVLANFRDRIEALFNPQPSAAIIEVQPEGQKRTVTGER